MDLLEIDWAACFTDYRTHSEKDIAGSRASKQKWNEKAHSFAHKPKRSGYIDLLIGLLALEDDDSVFDMGCGPGTLALPLAREGHSIVAVDFSPTMLEELNQSVAQEGLEDKIVSFERSWQQDTSDLPGADVAISSRSLVTEDLASAVKTLEAHANKRAVIVTGAGDLPYRDARILAAMGRSQEECMGTDELVIIINYLFSLGHLPRIQYIEVPTTWSRETRDDLVDAIYAGHEPKDRREEEALQRFLNDHIVFNPETQHYELDYPRINRWAYIEWNVPAR